MSGKTEFKHGVQYHLVQIASTPGLVLWLFNWLAIVLYVLYTLAVTTRSVQTYVAPITPEYTAGGVTTSQLLLAAAISLVIWYAIGFGVHLGLAKVADKFVDPIKAYRWLTIGGMVLGTLVLALGLWAVKGGVAFVLAALMSGVIGLISFGLQQLLAKMWNVELV